MGFARIDEKHASLLAISIALLGMMGLYFFGQQTGYEPAAPAMVAIMEDGALAQVEGRIESIEEKETTMSLRVCDGGKCVSVSAQKALAQNSGAYVGARVLVFGEVASYKGAKFLRASKIETGS